MRQLIKSHQSKRVVSMVLAILMVISAMPMTVTASAPEVDYIPLVIDENVVGTSELVTNISENTFEVGKSTVFTFKTVANGDAGIYVKGCFEFSDPTAISELMYLESDGEWYGFDGEFGPDSGFPMTDNAESTFCATFNKAGVYTLKSYMKQVSDGEVLCLTVSTVTVKERSEISFDNDTIEIKFSDKNAINIPNNSVNNAEFEYSSNDETVVKVGDDGKLQPVSLGEAEITVTRKENAQFFSSTASYKVKITEGVQDELSWSIDPLPPSINWNQNFQNKAEGGSGNGKVTYSSSDEAVATVDDEGNLNIKKTGSVTITATKSGEGLYADISSSYTILITQAKPNTIAFETPNPNDIVYGTVGFENKVIGAYENAVIKYKSENESVATVDNNGKLTVYKAGSAVIKAYIEESELYERSEEISYTINVLLAPQEDLAFEKGAQNQKITFGDSYCNKVINNNTSPIVYSSGDSDVATVDSLTGEVFAKKAGKVTITATLPASEQYAEMSISYELTIDKATQSVEFDNGVVVPNIKYGEEYVNAAKANTEIRYFSDRPEVAEVDENGKLITHKAGSVEITATAIENEQYKSASNKYLIRIELAQQSIEFENGDSVEITFNDNGNKYINQATSSGVANTAEDNSNITATYSIVDGNALAQINADTGELTILGAGSITVRVDFNENERFSSAFGEYTLTVKKSDQKIKFEKDAIEIINGDIAFVAPTASPEGTLYGNGDITYTLGANDDGVVTSVNIATGTLEFTNELGTVTVIATKAEDANYNKAVAEYTLTVKEWKEADFSDCFELVGTMGNDGWYLGDVSIKASEGYKLSYKKQYDTSDWSDLLENVLKKDGQHEISFYVQASDSGYISEMQTIKLKMDSTAPSLDINPKDYDEWEKLFSILTVGAWTSDNVDFKITYEEETSGISSLEYYIDYEYDGTIKSSSELDENTNWYTYIDDSITVVASAKFIVYAKATDNAGNVTYASTGGIIFDRITPKAELSVITEGKNGYYNKNVTLSVDVSDADPSSGIASVTYEITAPNKETEKVTLYQAAELEKLQYTDLEYDLSYEIEIDSEKFNSNGVAVTVKVVDNAGNVTEEKLEGINIDITPPQIEVSYNNNEPITLDGKRGYFDEDRIATVKITERNFDKAVAEGYMEGLMGAKVEWGGSTVNTDDPNLTVHTATIIFSEDNNYDFTLSYTDYAGNECTYLDVVFAEGTVAEREITVDKTKPTATVTIEGESWYELVETLTFGLWSNETVTVEIEPEDATSPTVEPVLYYKTDETKAKTKAELDIIYEDKKFETFNGLDINPNERFTVYFRVTDYAGNYEYFSSDGYIVDNEISNISIIAKTEPVGVHNGVSVFNKDVDIEISVKENEIYSGIKTARYWIICDGVTTQQKEFAFEQTYQDGHPTFDELLESKIENVTVQAKENNSCNVVVKVEVVDNAGNVSEEELKLDIDKTAPTISVGYDNNNVKKVVGDRGYYSADREAIITITERAEHFDGEKAIKGIKIKATDVNGKTIKVNDKELSVDTEGYLTNIEELFGELTWDSTVDVNTPDQSTHVLKLKYTEDANYEFDISYADLADNTNNGLDTGDSKTPFKFTVDKNDPTATVSIEKESWNKLVETLTFGLWSKDTVSVEIEPEDATSPTDVVYYKTADTQAKTENELESLYDDEQFKEFNGLDIDPNERFVVYFRVTDYAGNYECFSSDGYVVDNQGATIEIEATTEPVGVHNNVPVFNKDVDIEISVNENEICSGIKTARYWITCDGVTTQQKEFVSEQTYQDGHPTFDELLKSKIENVTVESVKNNSCNVVVNVEVVDNAGNVSKEELKIDIDIVPLTMSIDYDNDNVSKIVGDRGYYTADRVATITVAERAAHFDAEVAIKGIKIKATDVNGKTINVNNKVLAVDAEGYLTDIKELFGELNWRTLYGNTPDDATHILVLNFTSDANYTFEISYIDETGNVCEYDDVIFAEGTETKREFTVDKTNPTVTVTAGKGTWDILLETLTFGLWSNKEVSVEGTASDVTSGIEAVYYYKSNDTDILNPLEITDWEMSSKWKAFTETDKYHGPTVKDDEHFVVYVKIVDYAGNIEYISTNGIIVDDTLPVIDGPQIKMDFPKALHGIYNTDVPITVTVTDPKTGDTEAFSGIKSVRYEVYNMGVITQNGNLYENEIEAEDTDYEDLETFVSREFTVLAKVDNNKDNNSNNVKVVVYAEDNAGNTSEAECELKIDVTQPTIDVSYDNNSGDTGFGSIAYFDAPRVATVVVTERNFDPSLAHIYVNDDEYHVVWTTVEAGGNGDDTTHTAEVLFNYDGVYTLELECSDLATNINKAVQFDSSDMAQSFVIDLTSPVIKISYDNNNFKNGNYYNAERVATITVDEENFETTRMNITLTATNEGQEIELPVVSDWVTKGGAHVATITYSADALYSFDIEYTDMAGNKAAEIDEQVFYIDKTEPSISIENIVDESANNDFGDIGFVITVSDTNFDVFVPTLTAVVKNGEKFETRLINIGEMSDIKNGKIFKVKNIEEDGIYRITCKLEDKAGNGFTKVILEDSQGEAYTEKRTPDDVLVTFSVNRESSTFDVNKETISIVEKYYVKELNDDIVIVEVNADELMEYAVTLNGRQLVKDVDYTVEETGGDASWMKYTYNIRKSLFAEEGEYKLVVSSVDKADNDTFSDVKDATISFVVDRSAPVVTLSGLAANGRYQTESQTVTLIPTDDGGALKSLTVSMVDEYGNTTRELLSLIGDELISALEANEGKLNVEIPSGLYQNVRIICEDSTSDGANVYDVTFTNVSVSSSIFMIFWANKPLRYASIISATAIIAAVCIIIIFKKKRSVSAK